MVWVLISILTTNLVSLLPLAFPAFLHAMRNGKNHMPSCPLSWFHCDGCGLRAVQAGNVGPRVQYLATWPGGIVRSLATWRMGSQWTWIRSDRIHPPL